MTSVINLESDEYAVIVSKLRWFVVECINKYTKQNFLCEKRNFKKILEILWLTDLKNHALIVTDIGFYVVNAENGLYVQEYLNENNDDDFAIMRIVRYNGMDQLFTIDKSLQTYSIVNYRNKDRILLDLKNLEVQGVRIIETYLNFIVFVGTLGFVIYNIESKTACPLVPQRGLDHLKVISRTAIVGIAGNLLLLFKWGYIEILHVFEHISEMKHHLECVPYQSIALEEIYTSCFHTENCLTLFNNQNLIRIEVDENMLSNSVIT